MSKTALVLHGWPQKEINQHFFVKFLKEQGYKVVVPDLFLIQKDWDTIKVAEYITKEIGGEYPDIIIGISMGGLILPHVAIRYPRSKLIFISTSVKLNPNLFFTKLGVVILKIKILRNLFINIGDNISIPVLEFLYRLFNPFTGEKKDRILYEEDLKMNLRVIKEHSFTKHFTLLDMICSVDNTKILRKVNNKSLIYNGEKDKLMGKEGGILMHKLIKNSNLILNNGEHFNVFGKKDLEEVNKFLRA